MGTSELAEPPVPSHLLREKEIASEREAIHSGCDCCDSIWLREWGGNGPEFVSLSVPDKSQHRNPAASPDVEWHDRDDCTVSLHESNQSTPARTVVLPPRLEPFSSGENESCLLG